MGGYVMQLQNYSVNDGEGIRTNIFLAGCPLRCAWCANPEGQTRHNSMVSWMETEDILREIHRQSIFYRFSGGGVTFSGGEATAQPDFLKELTDILYDEGYSLALETCGHFDFASLQPVLQKMDLIFWDLKHIDSQMHRKYTGVDNQLILENLKRAGRLGIPLVVRIPVVGGVNCDKTAMEGAFAFLQKYVPEASLELLPYHRFGEDKYRSLGLSVPDESFFIPDADTLSHWTKVAESYGIHVVSYK